MLHQGLVISRVPLPSPESGNGCHGLALYFETIACIRKVGVGGGRLGVTTLWWRPRSVPDICQNPCQPLSTIPLFIFPILLLITSIVGLFHGPHHFFRKLFYILHPIFFVGANCSAQPPAPINGTASTMSSQVTEAIIVPLVWCYCPSRCKPKCFFNPCKNNKFCM